MSDKAIVIRGDFNDAEFALLVAVIRHIDSQRPDGHFEIIGIDPENNDSLEKAEQMLRKAMPLMEGRMTEMARFTYKDRRWEDLD